MLLFGSPVDQTLVKSWSRETTPSRGVEEHVRAGGERLGAQAAGEAVGGRSGVHAQGRQVRAQAALQAAQHPRRQAPPAVRRAVRSGRDLPGDLFCHRVS
jgi:hypothetical protein